MYQLKKYLKQISKTDYIFLVVLLIAATWYLTNLNGSLDHDEVRYATSGYRALVSGELFDLGASNHPPLIKYFFGLSQVIFGVNSFAIRLTPALFGLGVLVLVYLIGKTWSPFVGLCSTIMLIFTNGFSGRVVIGFLDAGLMFFIILTVFIFIKFKANKYFPLYFGISSGLIMMSKFTGIYVLLPIVLTILYLTYKEKNIRVTFWFSIGFFTTIILIYLPYILRDVQLLINTILFTGSLENRSPPYDDILTGLKWFLNASNFYNPLYAVGLVVAPLFLLFSKKLDEIFLAVVVLSYYTGIHITTRVAVRFILPMLPILSLLFFISVYRALQTVVPHANIQRSEKCLFSFFIILIVLLSPPLKLSPNSITLQPIYRDSNINTVIELIMGNSDENKPGVVNTNQEAQIVVATTRQPILLYYLGAPPETYINSIQSPNPPSGVYNYTMQVNGTNITMLWFGVDRDTDLEILRLVKKGKIDMIISHKPSLKEKSLNARILGYAERYERIKSDSNRGTTYEVYWMNKTKVKP